MNRTTISRAAGSGDRHSSTPISAAANMKARQVAKILEFKEALIGEGHDTFSKQAAVLGLARSTAWSVLKAGYKQSGLSASVIKQMLACPNLPARAHRVLEQYVQEKLLGAYGHNAVPLKIFQRKFGFNDEVRARSFVSPNCPNVHR